MGKAALEALALTLAKEERRNGIRVNIVAPGLVKTDMTAMAPSIFAAGTWEELGARAPFGRVCEPMDIAHVVRFLASDEAGYVTGQRITVDGGGVRRRR